MKKLLISSLITTLLLTGCNSNTNKSTQSKAVATTTITEQSSDVQKVGYSLGYDMGTNFKEVADDMDLEAFYQGIKDAYDNTDSKLSQQHMEDTVKAYLERKQIEAQKQLEIKAAENKAKGAAFLAENAKKEGVKTTASGLQYRVITEGSGQSPKATDKVVVHYEGKLIDGTVFDSSLERGEPVAFPLNQVISGWTEGLQLMKPGAKYEFFIPSDLAYGEAGNPDIEPNSVLIFTVELLDKAAADAYLKKAQAEQEAQMQQMMESMQQSEQSGDGH